MRVSVLAALGLFIATTASADITWKAHSMAPGSVVVLQSDDALFTHVRRSASDGLARFDAYAGTGTTARYIGSYLINTRGEVVREVSADGQETRYAPHRCQRSVGTCRYTVTHADGLREPRRRVTEETGNVLAYRDYGPDGLERSGRIALDAMGTTLSGWSKDHATGQITHIKQVATAYR